MLSLRKRVQCEKRITGQVGIPRFNGWKDEVGSTKETMEKQPEARKKNKTQTCVIMTVKGTKQFRKEEVINSGEVKQEIKRTWLLSTINLIKKSLCHRKFGWTLSSGFFTRCVTLGDFHSLYLPYLPHLHKKVVLATAPSCREDTWWCA